METKIGMYNMAKIQSIETQWLWYPYIPYGKVTIVQGDPGEGKTTLALNIAAALTRGETITGAKTAPPHGKGAFSGSRYLPDCRGRSRGHYQAPS